MSNAKKDIEIKKFLADMQKTFGDDTLMEFGQSVSRVEVIPTGIPSLDFKLGVGGIPRGRIVEIYGPEAAGKTTLAIKMMAQAQKMSGQLPKTTYEPLDIAEVKPMTGRVGFIDVEHAFSPSLAEIHGLQMGKGSKFYFTQPTGGDKALQMLEYMVCSNLFDIIVIDSVAGLTSLDEQEKDIGNKVIAGTASLMSSGLKKLVPLINNSKTIVIFINQLRDKPAVMFGSPETTPGGRALKFYSSIRVRVAKRGSIMEGTEQVGHTMYIDIKKNKVAPPFQNTEIDLLYRESKGRPAGFDIFGDLMEVAQLTGVVELRGSSYQYADKETGELFKANGKVKWREFLDSRPDVQDMIINEIMGGKEIDRKCENETSENEQQE